MDLHRKQSKKSLLLIIPFLMMTLRAQSESCEIIIGKLQAHIKHDLSSDKDFNPQIEAYLKERRARYIHQGYSRTSLDNAPLYSAGFSQCHAVLIRNLSNGKVTLMHVEPSGLRYEEAPWIRGKYKDSLFGLGDGPKEAIIVTGSISSEGGVVDSMSMLKNLSIPLVKRMRVNTNRQHWHIAYDPKDNRLFVSSKPDKTVFEVKAFAKFKVIQKPLSDFVSDSLPVLKLEANVKETIANGDRFIQTVNVKQKKFEKGGRDWEWFESIKKSKEKKLKKYREFERLLSIFKIALEKIRSSSSDVALRQLRKPAFTKFLQQKYYSNFEDRPLMDLLEFGERGLLDAFAELERD